MSDINRQVRFDAPPMRVATALAPSVWRSAIHIEPAGAGSRVVIAAQASPTGVAQAVEALALADVCDARRALEEADKAAEANNGVLEASGSWTGSRQTIDLEVETAAPSSAVWRVLADLDTVERWNPSVKRARITSLENQGLGTTRECALSPIGTVQERVTHWSDGQLMSVEVYRQRLVPLSCDTAATIQLQDRAQETMVRLHMEYSLRLGVVGRAVHAMALRRLFHRSVQAMLAGLKYHVETGASTPPKRMLPASGVRAA